MLPHRSQWWTHPLCQPFALGGEQGWHRLLESQQNLDHGEFQAMIDNELLFGRRAAQVFKASRST
jgi:hypothetical protein